MKDTDPQTDIAIHSTTASPARAAAQTTARRTLVAGIAVLGLTACAVTPDPLTERDVRARVQADQFRIYSAQDPIFKPVSFNEALARSLKYNLDYRLKLMEAALAQGLADVAGYDQLPNLLVSAGYTQRNNLTGSRSFDIINDQAVDRNPPSYSGGQDKGRRTASAEFSWNALDFGVGYYRAKQAANQVLIAEERRRRVVQNILSDVRSAYWRAVGAQRLAREAERLLERSRTALERSREAEAQGLLAPRDALNYQRLLLDTVTLLSSRRVELDLAKRELSALMNITPGTDFTVADEAEPALMPAPVNVAELEELALVNRPELRQEDYQVRITAAEARKQLLYLLPNLSLNLGAQYDSNKYLYSNDWFDAGARVSFNLFKALAIPATRNAQEAQMKTDDMRRMALSMAILTQVRVAVERYKLTLADLEVAKESNQVDQRMAIFARAALTSRADSEMETIRAEVRALNSEFQRYGAYAAAQAAFARIYNSIGLEVVPGDLGDAPLSEIGSKVSQNLAQVENETFVRIVTTPAPVPPLAVRFDGSEAAATGIAISTATQTALVGAAERALRRNQLEVTQAGTAPVLSLRLLSDTPKDGVRRAQWRLTLRSADGTVLGQTIYASTLATEPTGSSLTAFAEAAVIANLRTISGWLQPRRAP